MALHVNISFAASALGDLEELLDYYRKQDVPHVGERLVAEIIHDIELLSRQPGMGRVVPEFEAPHLRELIRPPFRIVYRYDRNRVRIVRVWRSERSLKLP
jgi:plasmid stabilization system protein ParE